MHAFFAKYFIASAAAVMVMILIMGSAFPAGMPAQTPQAFDPASLAGTWASDGEKGSPALRVNYDKNRGVFEFFQMRNEKWEKFAQVAEGHLQNVWLIKSEDGNFHLGIPAVNLGLRKVDK